MDLTAFRAFRDAAATNAADTVEARQAAIAAKMMEWLGTVPSTLLDAVEHQLDAAMRAHQADVNPLAGLAAFFGGVQAPEGNGNTPPALGAGSPAPAADSLLSIEQQRLVDAVDGRSATEIRFWTQSIVDAKDFGNKAGLQAAVADILTDNLRVTSDGRPLAEAEVRRLHGELDTANDKIAQLESSLRAAKAASISDEMFKTVVTATGHVNTTLGFTAPTTVKVDDATSVKEYLDTTFQTQVRDAVKTLNDRVTDAEAKVTNNKAAATAALTALAKVTTSLATNKVTGKEAVEVELKKITS